MLEHHHLNVKIYHEDLDIGGVVYYANYLKYMERGRTEWFSESGFDQLALIEQGVLFVVRSAQVEYLRAARFGDTLEIKTKINKLGKASLVFEQTIRSSQQDCDVCTGLIKVACVSKDLKPISIPKEIISEY